MLEFLTSFLSASIRCAMPVFIAALGLVYNERAGVVNIGVEGMMIVGALAGYSGSYFLGSAWLGLLVAGIAGLFMGLLMGAWTITLRANQAVVGAAINIIGAGLATTLNRMLFGLDVSVPNISSFTTINAPHLARIPVLGEVLFSHNILVYLALAMMFITHTVLFRTEMGLRIRAVGENPRSCDTLGINVYRVRYGTVLFGAIMSALAGAYLSIAQLAVFVEDMVSGRGFIAIAAVVFGKRNPFGVLLAALVFGAGEALQYKLTAGNVGIPYQFAQMIPYVLTILSLIGVVGKSETPAASGVPYIKE